MEIFETNKWYEVTSNNYTIIFQVEKIKNDFIYYKDGHYINAEGNYVMGTCINISNIKNAKEIDFFVVNSYLPKTHPEKLDLPNTWYVKTASKADEIKIAKWIDKRVSPSVLKSLIVGIYQYRNGRYYWGGVPRTIKEVTSEHNFGIEISIDRFWQCYLNVNKKNVIMYNPLFINNLIKK